MRPEPSGISFACLLNFCYEIFVNFIDFLSQQAVRLMMVIYYLWKSSKMGSETLETSLYQFNYIFHLRQVRRNISNRPPLTVCNVLCLCSQRFLFLFSISKFYMHHRATFSLYEMKKCFSKLSSDWFISNIFTFPKQAFNESLDFCNRS